MSLSRRNLKIRSTYLFFILILIITQSTKAESLSERAEIDGGLYNSSITYRNYRGLLQYPTNVTEWLPITPPTIIASESIEYPAQRITYDSINQKEILVERNREIEPEEIESLLLPSFNGLLPPNLNYEKIGVFPPDDRIKVTSTTSYPWRTIARARFFCACPVFTICIDSSITFHEN